MSNQLPPLKRLIVIDAANFIHGVKEYYPAMPNTDDRPNALPLALFTHELLKHGFNVRICWLKHLRNDIAIRNFFALEALIAAGLVIEPISCEKESDDKAALRISEKYGACIISQDRYANHREFLSIPASRFLRFEIGDADMRSDDFIPPFVPIRLRPEVGNNLSDCLFATPNCESYEKVKESHSYFQLNQTSLRNLRLLNKFVHDKLYIAYHMELPPDSQFLGDVNNYLLDYAAYVKLWLKNHDETPEEIEANNGYSGKNVDYRDLFKHRVI
uniref:RNase NYN domain-containing protein n=1 Tax=Panagrolaimus sp. JU765 TaxID=591449 RepID=A0AC34Q4P7_9BILA